MIVKVSSISQEGLHLDLNAQTPWMVDVLTQAFPVEKPDPQTLKGHMDLQRFDDQVHVTGHVDVTLNHACDRCLEPMSYSLATDITMDLTPASQVSNTIGDEELELTEQDLEFSFYNNDEFDLSEIVRDQMVLSLPQAFICKESCKGLCSQCGVNLNQKSCTCDQNLNPVSPWAALKGFKPKTQQ
ncbi:DUF177 domain-containing protein [bacterium]|nr:DUF177 domain-containing protein [bacterium]